MRVTKDKTPCLSQFLLSYCMILEAKGEMKEPSQATIACVNQLGDQRRDTK